MQIRPSHSSWGSPPLTRGKAHSLKTNFTPLRITPAYAGKSESRHDLFRHTKDHPRLRGEKYNLLSGELGWTGSPPLTRGKAAPTDTQLTSERITPAYAGKSPAQLLVDFLCRDHPRLRGEKLSEASSFNAIRGSPPLTRGKDCASSVFALPTRITPAYAGKRRITSTASTMGKDHPRLRGEKYRAIMPTRAHEGSPPLTRGKD